jgi:hypothetical protein
MCEGEMCYENRMALTQDHTVIGCMKETAVARGLGKHVTILDPLLGNGYACNNRGTVAGSVFYAVHPKIIYQEPMYKIVRVVKLMTVQVLPL